MKTYDIRPFRASMRASARDRFPGLLPGPAAGVGLGGWLLLFALVCVVGLWRNARYLWESGRALAMAARPDAIPDSRLAIAGQILGFGFLFAGYLYGLWLMATGGVRSGCGARTASLHRWNRTPARTRPPAADSPEMSEDHS